MPRLRVVPPVYLAATLAAMVALHLFLPLMRLIAVPWNLLGILPIAAGLLLGVSAVRLFRAHQTTIRPGQPSKQLIIRGPFRITRNPMYLGMVLILAGIALLLGSLSPWLPIPLFIALIAFNVIPLEEAMLAKSFGPDYQHYKSHVRRWL